MKRTLLIGVAVILATFALLFPPWSLRLRSLSKPEFSGWAFIATPPWHQSGAVSGLADQVDEPVLALEFGAIAVAAGAANKRIKR